MATASTAAPLVGSATDGLGTAVFLAAFGLIALVLLHAKIDHVLETVGGDGTAAGSKANCPACGARIAVDADRCEDCDRSSTDSAASSDVDRDRIDGPASDETPNYDWIDE